MMSTYIMSAKLPIIKEPHPQPLPKSGEGRQSTALAGWGSSGLISNQADMILLSDELLTLLFITVLSTPTKYLAAMS